MTTLGGFIDGNDRKVNAGDRVEYKFEDHRCGILDEALQDGDAYVTWDDGAKGTVKWHHLAKIPEDHEEGLSADILTVLKTMGWRREDQVPFPFLPPKWGWYLFLPGTDIRVAHSGTVKWSEDVVAAKDIVAHREAKDAVAAKDIRAALKPDDQSDVWAPTLQLRWSYREHGEAILQQKWIRTRGADEIGKGSSEWRHVPMVKV